MRGLQLARPSGHEFGATFLGAEVSDFVLEVSEGTKLRPPTLTLRSSSVYQHVRWVTRASTCRCSHSARGGRTSESRASKG